MGGQEIPYVFDPDRANFRDGKESPMKAALKWIPLLLIYTVRVTR